MEGSRDQNLEFMVSRTDRSVIGATTETVTAVSSGEVSLQESPAHYVVGNSADHAGHEGERDGEILQQELKSEAICEYKDTDALTPDPDRVVDGSMDGEKEVDDNSFAWDASKHILVLSSAGKPVFSLVGDEQRLSTLMGLIQGLLSLCADCGDEMESIRAHNRRFVFIRRGELVLVAVSSSSGRKSAGDGEGDSRDDEGQDSETFLQLQLEYMYSNIVFLLTAKVQSVFRRSPSYDLRELLGGADPSLRGVVELAEPSRGQGRMLGGGVETVWMDPDMRSRISSTLQIAEAMAAPSALYAIWLFGEQLIALAQPREPSHRLHSQDLLLLINFIATQPALRTAESWTPVCFPRFQDQGYLYAYIVFLDDPDMEDHQSTRSSVRDEIDPGTTDSGKGNESQRTGDTCLILVSAESSAEQFQAFRRSRMAIESRFRVALGAQWSRYLSASARIEREGILRKFCSHMHALHFFYSLRGRHGGAPCVTQVLSSPFAFDLAKDRSAHRRIWGHYTRAALRLRRGSSQEGRVFCREEDVRCGTCVPEEEHGYSEANEATAIFETDPVHSLTYEIGATETVVSLFGNREEQSSASRWSPGGSTEERDELHVCFPAATSAEVAYNAAIRLVAIIRRDREWLFLGGTGVAK